MQETLSFFMFLLQVKDKNVEKNRGNEAEREHKIVTHSEDYNSIFS